MAYGGGYAGGYADVVVGTGGRHRRRQVPPAPRIYVPAPLVGSGRVEIRLTVGMEASPGAAVGRSNVDLLAWAGDPKEDDDVVVACLAALLEELAQPG